MSMTNTETTGYDMGSRNRMRGIRGRFAGWRVYRRTRSELMNLSNRELDDLGLSRSDIEDIAREAAYGPS